MQVTTKLPKDRLESYFDAFTKHFLRNETTNAADVEVLSNEWGDQFEAEGAHLAGVTYDPKADALEIYFEGGDHRLYNPAEVWTVEDTDGFVRAIEIVLHDGTREVVRVRRLGVRPRG
jgi:uncharacterized protein YuzE